jgi:hypothetical protein
MIEYKNVPQVICDILTQGINRIDRILILPRYTFFSGSSTIKNFGVKHASSGAILGWMAE